jgi:hypothetical protein
MRREVLQGKIGREIEEAAGAYRGPVFSQMRISRIQVDYCKAGKGSCLETVA